MRYMRVNPANICIANNFLKCIFQRKKKKTNANNKYYVIYIYHLKYNVKRLGEFARNKNTFRFFFFFFSPHFRYILWKYMYKRLYRCNDWIFTINQRYNVVQWKKNYGNKSVDVLFCFILGGSAGKGGDGWIAINPLQKQPDDLILQP